jgi:hypothetical protein
LGLSTQRHGNFQPMIDGIYSVSLTAHSQPIGEGILVFKGGTFNGGGLGYLYRGFYNAATETIKSELLAYRKERATIFADRDNYHLEPYPLELTRDRQQAKLIFSGQFGTAPARTVMAEFVWEASVA